ncbi:MAG: glycosyltransferase [Myxococcales bacterium]|nr:glycosyltransferase [Myxococcales bacterium]
MKICHITNFWPNYHGHAHYTENLIDGVRTHDAAKHFVCGEGNTAAHESESYIAAPVWSRDGDYVETITAHLRSIGAEIAIVQYSNDLFGDDNRLPRLLASLEAAGVRSIVVNHSIYPETWKTRYQPGADAAHFDRAVAGAASCMVVHSERMRRDLVSRGVSSRNVVVIPHGSKAMERRDPAESRRELGLPEGAPVVLFFGFIWLGKGLDFLLDVFARVKRRLPQTWFYIGGYTRQKVFYTKAYMAYLKARMWSLGIAKQTRLFGDYVPDERVPTIYSAADVVAMPYNQPYSSVSGVVHQTAGIGKLMLCSQIPKFDEVEQYISPDLVVPHDDKRAWSDQLVRLLTDASHAETMRARIERFAAETSWPVVAKRHVELYRALLAGQDAASIGAQWTGQEEVVPLRFAA